MFSGADSKTNPRSLSAVARPFGDDLAITFEEAPSLVDQAEQQVAMPARFLGQLRSKNPHS
jgi:hypothetical protein